MYPAQLVILIWLAPFYLPALFAGVVAVQAVLVMAWKGARDA